MTEKAQRKTETKEERLKKLEDKIEKLKRMKREVLTKEAKKKRDERTHKLATVGGLADIANLIDTDKGTLLGAFLEIASIIKENPDKANTWKSQGDNTLAKREAERRKEREKEK